MLETAVVSFTTFFATVGPIDVAAMFAAMTAGASVRLRRVMAIRGTLIATLVLVIFALAGDMLLAGLGISLEALRIAGGILLLLIGIDMVFARSSGGTSTTDDEAREARTKPDISVFPLATPLIAGPGAMGAAILLMADSAGDVMRQAAVLGALCTVMLLTLSLLLLAGRVQRLFGVTGMHVISRVFGVLLSALAVQFIIDGIRESRVLS